MKFKNFVPALLWMGFMFFLSNQQTTGIGGGTVERFFIMKSFHIIEYAVLFVLLNFGFFDKKKSLASGYLFALSDELHQYFVPGRTAKFVDTLIDILGMLIGIIIWTYGDKLVKYIYDKRRIATKINRSSKIKRTKGKRRRDTS